jgi:hypothetical protein
MYALPLYAIDHLVDERNFEFGDTFVRFTDITEFLRRVRTAAEQIGQEFCSRLVEYVPDTYNGVIGPFRKMSLFAYQCEFRIALKPGTGAPLTLDIGNLRDITAFGPITVLNREVKEQWAISNRD